MTPEKKVHPLRRKHRRGKRSGKKHRNVPLAPAVVSAPSPTAVVSLRSRLSLLAKSHG